jgi:hypothetical protein
VVKASNDNETNEESERAARLRTLARLARKGNVKPFDIVTSGPDEKREGRG